MDTEGDLECTCDVGPFATCPVCLARQARAVKELDEEIARARHRSKERRDYRKLKPSMLDLWNVGR